MKAGKIIPSALLILIFSGCGNRYTQNETILKAESLLFNYPDSAFNLLISIKKPEKLSKADYAAWCLHLTHSQYKLYMDIKSDSLIKIAVQYFDETSLNTYSGTSYYLWGCILEIKNNSKSAMYAYKKANDYLDKTELYDVKGLVCYKIGNLYLLDEYYNESEDYFKRSLSCFEKSNNTKYQAYAYRAIAELLFRQNSKLSEILLITERCLELSKKANDKAYYYDNLVFKANVLMTSDLNMSKNLLLSSFHNSPNKNNNLSVSLSFIYSKLNMADSAIYYSKFIQNSKQDKNILLLNYLTRAYIASCEKKNDSAFNFMETAYELQDSIYKQSIREQLIRVDKQYDLSKKEAEKAKLEIQNQKNIILIAFLSIMILAILLILLFITNLNKKRQDQLIIEKQKLEFDVKAKQVENDKNLKILLTELQNKIDNTLHFKRIQSNLAKVEKKEEFIAEITRQSVLNNIERQFYIYEADKLFDGRIMNLKSDFPQLTDSDLIVISLICIGIDITNSILLLDYANINTMYIRRNRIKKHLGLDKSTDLEKWLRKQVVEHD